MEWIAQALDGKLGKIITIKMFLLCVPKWDGFFIHIYKRRLGGCFYFAIFCISVFENKKSMSRADSRFGFALGSMFVNERFAGNSREIATGMIQDIKTAFKEGLTSLDWMDEATAGFLCVLCFSICCF